jgi:hypothetical protein
LGHHLGQSHSLGLHSLLPPRLHLDPFLLLLIAESSNGLIIIFSAVR